VTVLDATRHTTALADLGCRQFDVVVIGGGITGAGVAREAVARGMSVALIEAEDFASGTSSRSSKLIHGGLRYLAMGDVALVRETALERKVVRRMAPHLAQRRWMVLPVRSRAGLLKFRTAIATYEKLGAVEGDDLHRNWNTADLEREEPVLDRERFPFAVAYREYLTDDARLVIANLRAAVAGGAQCVNHLKVARLLLSPSARVRGVEAVCSLSGEAVKVSGSVVVNAAGPWVEALRRLEDADAPSVLALSKGVHLCFARDRLPVRNLLLLTTTDGRTIFAIPRGEVTYVGTTDTAYSGAATVWPEILAADIDYLLEPLARYCPTAPVGVSDIVAAWAGLRPLIAQPGKAVVDLSRKDEVTVGRSGLVTVAGGKLTGFRLMARRIVDIVDEVLGRDASGGVTDAPLPGGDFAGGCDELAARAAARCELDDHTARRLVGLYGSEIDEVLALGRDLIVDGADLVDGEVVWAVTREGACRIEDVLYRRTRTALYQPSRRAELIGPIGDRMAEMLGWSPRRLEDEKLRTVRLMADELPRDLLRS